MKLDAIKVFSIHVKCDGLMETGRGLNGDLRIIPIVGGDFDGEGISGKVLAGGADWNTKKTLRYTHVFAKYILETQDGSYISVQNEGVYDKQNMTMIKTVLKFDTELNGPYGYLNTGVYVGELNSMEKEKNMVEIVVYKLL